MITPEEYAGRALEGLPHGPEFKFLDRITNIRPGTYGEGEYRVRGDESFLSGHFPGNPIFPGVLLAEAAAQLAGAIAQCDPLNEPLDQFRLTALKGIKIFGTAKPGETIQLRARITGRLDTLVQASVEAFVNGRQVLTGEVTLSGLREAPSS